MKTAEDGEKSATDKITALFSKLFASGRAAGVEKARAIAQQTLSEVRHVMNMEI
ncbi:MAG: hypothetical protein K6G80_00485 [Treponema sp.]|nr:hypothetical protein [Treponema sp.]